MKVKQMIELCQSRGWYHIKTRGSHRHFKHPKIPGKITIPGNYLSKELKPGIEHQILKKIAV